MTVIDQTFAGVLFDNDGTLVNSIAAVERAWGTWAQEYDVALDGLVGFHGVTAAGIIARIAPDADQAAALQRIIDLEVADVSDVAILPGALQAIADCGDRATIVTSATRDLAEARLGAVGIAVPGAMVTADDVRRGKPDPEPYLAGAAKLGVDPARCLVVEDAPSGLTAARAAGCATLAVICTHTRDELDADLVVENLSEVRFVRTEDGVRVERAG